MAPKLLKLHGIHCFPWLCALFSCLAFLFHFFIPPPTMMIKMKTMTTTARRLIRLLFVSSLLMASVATAESTCERLKATLTYTQEEAPRDLSSVLPVVVEKVNRVLDGVVDVEVEWTGAELHGRVGEHIIECTVTRLASAADVASEGLQVAVDDSGREVTSQCFHVSFTILDTNECTLPPQHPMRHSCPPPSVCVNTIGSYECLCPRLNQPKAEIENLSIDNENINSQQFWNEIASQDRSPWELSFGSASKSSCPSMASTFGCCPSQITLNQAHTCRSNFHCPVDPCLSSTNDCASNAQCHRSESPLSKPNYSCECPNGLMGNGHACQPKDPKPQPKVMFDGVTPTELTIKNNFYCGCTKPVVDACSGFPPCQGKHEICTVSENNSPVCACKPGYVLHEQYGCVDVHPPTLKLRHDPQGDSTLRLKQGDVYKEHMVDIIDENAEEYLRSLKISYSQALPPGCLTQVGEFHVNYTVAMPWTTPPYVRIQRRVVVDDIDECRVDVSKFQHSCPSLVPQCDRAAGAKCINTIGSYACQCPSATKGDGFLKTAKFPDFDPPRSYHGGASCVDTSKPVITLNGPNPKVFQICECGGLSGIMSQSKSADNNQLENEQRKLYEQDIKEMIRATAGAELCASHDNPNPKPQNCVKAIDRTYQGDVDLSNRVVVGEPVMKSELHWSVPYNVKDDAGNEATTVWRDVVVKEVDLASVEKHVREEMDKAKDAEIKKAVQKAIREERGKWDREQRTNNRRNSQTPCPTCPPCDCPSSSGGGSNDRSSYETDCSAYCDNMSRSCTPGGHDSILHRLLDVVEATIPPAFLPVFVCVVIGFSIILFFQFLSAVFNPRAHQRYDYGRYGDSNDEMLLRTPIQSPPLAPAPPKESLSTTAAQNDSFFSPPRGGMKSPSASNNGFSGLGPTQQQQQFSNGFGGAAATPGTHQRRQQQPSPFIRSPNPPENGGGGGGGGGDQYNYDDSIYNSPPIITPSRAGDGIRRRGPYT